MKNKKIKIVVVIIALLFATGCDIKKDNLENSIIYTTVRPIKYITEYLYNDYAQISSIYPENSNIDNYKLTKKQIKEYANSDLFIYNGLTDEKDIAKTLLNKNKNLLIIDVSYGLSLDNDIKELWLSPNNYLMLAKTVKTNLQEYINNKSIIDDIESKYMDFEEKISILDASLNEIGKLAKENNKQTIIVDDNSFKYLENYGFKVISLMDEKNLKDNKINNIKTNFNDKKYTFILDSGSLSETAQSLIDNNEAKLIKVDSMTTSLNDDYFNLMNEYIQNLKKIVS